MGYLRSNGVGVNVTHDAEALKILNPSDRRAPVADVQLEKSSVAPQLPADASVVTVGEATGGKQSQKSSVATRSSIAHVSVNIGIYCNIIYVHIYSTGQNGCNIGFFGKHYF